MSQVSNSEIKSMKWSAIIIISVGLLLLVLQLGMQFFIDYECMSNDKFKCAASRGDGGATSYIGLVVLLVGVALMALIALLIRSRADNGPVLIDRTSAADDHARRPPVSLSALRPRLPKPIPLRRR